LSLNLSRASQSLLTVLNSEKVTSETFKELQTIIDILKKPYEDVELSIIGSLEKLVNYCGQNYLTP
jgi:hypothetical protein